MTDQNAQQQGQGTQAADPAVQPVQPAQPEPVAAPEQQVEQPAAQPEAQPAQVATAPATTPATTPAPDQMPEALQKINRDLKEKAVREHATKVGLPYIDIEKTPLNPDLASLISEEEALKGLAIPFFQLGKKLRVAIFDEKNPDAQAAINVLKEKGYLININIASDEGIQYAIGRLYEESHKQKKSELVTEVKEEELEAYEKEIQNLVQLKDKLQSITSEEALNLINVGAIKTGASDIHFQPEEDRVLVRFRIDGVLQKIFEMHPKVFTNLANQLKYKAGMKLNITNVPQDGRFHFLINDRKIDVRVSALPTEFGETFVCRLLDSGKGFLDFKDCGFIGRNLELMDKSAKIAHGMILVTGPTGSGKTTTLYSMLKAFNKPQTKVITLEDPIEYHLTGISQSQINVKREYTFASGLRSILRQDPDVVMVGEIRDLETAETAAQAALTGHVLLSTLHTNSALESIPRLVNIGLPSFMVAPSMHMIVAQRLVRKLCPECRKKEAITESERTELDTLCKAVAELNPQTKCAVPSELWHAEGCDACSHTGYSGQMGIHEILVVDDEIKRLILDGASPEELKKQARAQGMLTMREDGLLKVIAEITTLEEVERVTQLL